MHLPLKVYQLQKDDSNLANPVAVTVQEETRKQITPSTQLASKHENRPRRAGPAKNKRVKQRVWYRVLHQNVNICVYAPRTHNGVENGDRKGHDDIRERRSVYRTFVIDAHQ
ncbi:hypothetical protein EVAR_30615_1 [Eumeta japonica]|uniref:Uncharacterized protein n=1 Tax=Eumeta variegata TaxID=151549 RepID=A0A4C1W822_EUMVA|nr:hypothetical protein EVAR_30615_1 [Eumeta japonica]